MSIYFGWLFWQTESLWVPVLAHAGYDFLMLLWMRWFADTSDLDGGDLDGGDLDGDDLGGGDLGGDDLYERELEASGSDTRGSDAGDSVANQSEASDERQNSTSAVDPKSLNRRGIAFSLEDLMNLVRRTQHGVSPDVPGFRFLGHPLLRTPVRYSLDNSPRSRSQRGGQSRLDVLLCLVRRRRPSPVR